MKREKIVFEGVEITESSIKSYTNFVLMRAIFYLLIIANTINLFGVNLFNMDSPYNWFLLLIPITGFVLLAITKVLGGIQNPNEFKNFLYYVCYHKQKRGKDITDLKSSIDEMIEKVEKLHIEMVDKK